MLETLLGAGLKLVGGLMGQNQAKDAQEAANAQAAANIKSQYEFAQNAIQWKAADAAKAGIHPLYALGASTTSFSPVSVGQVTSSPLGEALGSIGQDVTRAASANRSPTERLNAIGKVQTAQQMAGANLSLENQKLQNEILKIRVANMRGAQIGPGGPEEEGNLLIPGQGNTAGINPEPMKVAPAGSAPSGEAGSITDIGWARTSTGWAPTPSKDVKERIEDNIIQEGLHAFRNNLLPSLGQNMVAPPFNAPDGQSWWFNTAKQEYQLWPIGKRPPMGHPVPSSFKSRFYYN